MIRYRTCSKCGIAKPLTEEYFNKEKSNAEGYRKECKECRAEYKKQYRVKNREKIVASKKEYYEKNKESIHEKTRQWREENKEHIKEYSKRYAQENREKRVKWNQEWLDRNPWYKGKWKKDNEVLVKRYNKKWRNDNIEHVKQYTLTYRLNNRERFIEYEQRRRAKKRNLPYTLKLKDWEQIQEDFDYKCAYCGEEKILEREHFIPLNKGGEYTHNNIIPACKNCNSSKQDKDFFEWYPKQEFYSKEREKKILKYLNYNDKGIQQLSIL